MPLPAKIFLMGMPGSGKSTLGEKLARALKYNFIDLDEAIESHAGTKISEIFKERGEEYFRSIEADQLRQIIENQERFILSLGGGTPCFHGNMDLISGVGVSIFINIDLKEISRRLENDSHRPLVRSHSNNLDEYLKELFDQRLPFFEMADLEYDGKDLLKLIAELERFNLKK